MKWSKNLFLKINNKIGEHKLLDRFMVFCADDLVYILIFTSFMWATTSIPQGDEGLKMFIKLLMTAGFFGFFLSWTTALISPNKRPVDKLPRVKQLLEPISKWKSFPSDHTIASFTIALITALMGAPIWFYVPLFIMAALISFGRVYVGVHYPKDVIGGILVALIFSFSSFWLLENITQPIYDLTKQLFLL